MKRNTLRILASAALVVGLVTAAVIPAHATGGGLPTVDVDGRRFVSAFGTWQSTLNGDGTRNLVWECVANSGPDSSTTRINECAVYKGNGTQVDNCTAAVPGHTATCAPPEFQLSVSGQTFYLCWQASAVFLNNFEKQGTRGCSTINV